MEVAVNEQVMVARAQVDPAAFTALYDRFFPRVYGYIRYRVRDSHVAADLTADVFERAYQHLHRYDPQRAAFSTWLFSIAQNATKNHYRRQALRQWLPLDWVAERPTGAPLPEATVAEKEQLADLLAALQTLSDREREMIALKFGAEMRNTQIAEVLGLTETNVGVILYRTVRKLKTALGGGDQHD